MEFVTPGGAMNRTPSITARTVAASLVVLLAKQLCACGNSGSSDGPAPRPDAPVSGTASPATADPSPVISFVQVASAVGIDRSREPASAGRYTSSGTLAYGSWLADLDGDGRLDYYAVNHAQWPHLSGLFINDGAGGFGPNLFTLAVEPAAQNPADLGLSNEATFVGDLTGDGRVDLFFRSWSGFGAMCVNQGVVAGLDWAGPQFTCFGTSDALAFGDVNGDGRIDVLAVSPSGFDAYDAYYSNTASYVWRLNNGDPNIQTWPTTGHFLDLRVFDPGSQAPPYVDLNGDGIPDKIVGIPLPPGSRGMYSTATAGKQVFLGQASGNYALRSGTGLEEVTDPITAVEDVDGDGCLDIGADMTGYRNNQDWYVQDRVDDRCNVTFRLVARTALPYYPGFKRYAADIDNSGLLSKVVLIHGAYGSNDGRPIGVTIHRKLVDGTYVAIPPAESSIDIAAGGYEFYADNLSLGDWDDDGRLDLAGSGAATIPGTDSGFALWTSRIASSNGWIKISLPTVTGFFGGAATIEVFDAGFVGDASHLVTPPMRLYTGRTWGSQVHHLGIGTRPAVDVRVTFPDGREAIRAGVASLSRLVIEPGSFPGPVAVVAANPASTVVGQTVSFDASASTASGGSIVGYAWSLGDGSGASGPTVSHAYTAAGTFVATLTVTDDRGATGMATATINVVVGQPDLTVMAVSGPAGAEPGSAISVANTVQNVGTAAAGGFRVGIYLSTDPVITTADALMGTRTVAGLGVGESSTEATVVTVPAATASGAYYLRAIADDLGAVAEGAEGNNALSTALSVAVATVADLTVTTVNAPSSGWLGGTITVRTTVTNVGPADSPSAAVSIHLSRDPTISPDDLLLAGWTVQGLAPQGASSNATAVVLPTGIAVGGYYLIAVVDPSGAIAETSETNNLRSVAINLKRRK